MEILHVIKTSRYESDGRLLKWIDSLRNAGHTSSVFLIEDTNVKGVYLKEDVIVHKERLNFRTLFKKHSGIVLKAMEQGVKWARYYRKRHADAVVFHDVQQYLNIYLTLVWLKAFDGHRPKFIWDLHELPHSILSSNFVTRKWIRYLLSSVDLLVYTNIERRDFILQKYGHNERDYLILNNFPDEEFIVKAKTAPEGELKGWIASQNNKPYLLWMGAATPSRYFGVVIEVFRKYHDRFNLVVMGNVDDVFKDETDEYIRKGKLFARFVSQSEVINYVDNAQFSIVLYNADTPNNNYCEPNRLYQLISRNVPIITGCNPTMANWMLKLNAGVVLQDDGRDVRSLTAGLENLFLNYDQYKENLRTVDKAEIFDWKTQFDSIVRFIENC